MPPRPLKSSKPNPKADAESQEASFESVSAPKTEFQSVGQGLVPSDSYEETPSAIATGIGETQATEAKKTWYGSTWPRTPKATPVTQVAKESISTAGAAALKAAETARKQGSPNPTPPLRSPPLYLSRNVGSSSRLLPLAATTTRVNVTSNATGNGDRNTVSQDRLGETGPNPNGADKSKGNGVDEKNVQSAGQHGIRRSSADILNAEDKQGLAHGAKGTTSGWMGWFARPADGQSQKPSTLHQNPTTKEVQISENDIHFGSTHEGSRSQDDTSEQQTSILTPVVKIAGREQASRSWLALWGTAQSPDIHSEAGADGATRIQDLNSGQDQIDLEGNVGSAMTASNVSDSPISDQMVDAGKSSGWAFWSRSHSVQNATSDSLRLGKTAVAESFAKKKPKHTVMDGTKGTGNHSKGDGFQPMESSRCTNVPYISESAANAKALNSDASPATPVKTTRATKPKQESINLLLPSFEDTYRLVPRPGMLQQLSRLLQYHKSFSQSKHVHLLQEPAHIKKALAIGVHGYFPAPLLRSVLGQPTGTSMRFANGAANAIQAWTLRRGYSCEIEKIALEGEGKIAERLDVLWKLLLNWMEDIRKADFIMIACHSQGVPVTMMLVSKLIAFGCVSNARIGVCAMAGVNLGPFGDYKSRWISGSAGELFDFAQADSEVSKAYETALSSALRFGARVLYVGSIDDQLVSLESSTFGPVDHPYIFRAVFVDGRLHAPDFLSRLVGFALKLRNLGVSDHGLIRELSTPLAGSLYGGEGHSRLYDDDAVYYLAIQHALETTSVGDIAVQKNRHGPAASQNPYILPFAMRGVLEEDYVRTELYYEMIELVSQFENWKPSSKVLKDVKFRLEGEKSTGTKLSHDISSMGPFDLFQKKGSKALQAQPLKVRKQVVTSTEPQEPLRSTSTAPNNRPVPSRKAGSTLATKAQPAKSRSPNPRKRATSGQPRLESDSEEGNTDNESTLATVKRVRLSTEPVPDSNRQIRSTDAFVEGNDCQLARVHAADIAAMDKPTKFKPAFLEHPDAKLVSLQYPSASDMERYCLVDPVQSDEFNTLDEIREIILITINLYVPDHEAALMKDDTHGLLRRLKRAMARRQADEYIEILHEWNGEISRLRHDGALSKKIDSWKIIDLALIERILTQTYSRIVSPRVGLLKQYENGTDNVYGELLPKFVSDILCKDTRIRSDQLFVDLGSGVGNVVLQAALQIGCESWGCEMMDNACDLAELQKREFNARCHLWGLTAGSINLERGDFLENAVVGRVLKRADVVLVNNQAFTPDLNEALTNLFLDLKEGCLIVSLKSFVPAGHKITARNLNRACNVLEVEEKKYYSNCVSWTDAPGTYFISKKASSRVAAFASTNA